MKLIRRKFLIYPRYSNRLWLTLMHNRKCHNTLECQDGYTTPYLADRAVNYSICYKIHDRNRPLPRLTIKIADRLIIEKCCSYIRPGIEHVC